VFFFWSQLTIDCRNNVTTGSKRSYGNKIITRGGERRGISGFERDSCKEYGSFQLQRRRHILIPISIVPWPVSLLLSFPLGRPVLPTIRPIHRFPVKWSPMRDGSSHCGTPGGGFEFREFLIIFFDSWEIEIQFIGLIISWKCSSIFHFQFGTP
jgi:hypothetical protein